MQYLSEGIEYLNRYRKENKNNNKKFKIITKQIKITKEIDKQTVVYFNLFNNKIKTCRKEISNIPENFKLMIPETY